MFTPKSCPVLVVSFHPPTSPGSQSRQFCFGMQAEQAEQASKQTEQIHPPKGPCRRYLPMIRYVVPVCAELRSALSPSAETIRRSPKTVSQQKHVMYVYSRSLVPQGTNSLSHAQTTKYRGPFFLSPSPFPPSSEETGGSNSPSDRCTITDVCPPHKGSDTNCSRGRKGAYQSTCTMYPCNRNRPISMPTLRYSCMHLPGGRQRERQAEG